MGLADLLRAVFVGPPKPAVDPDAFSAAMAERLRAARPAAEVRVDAPLGLTLIERGSERALHLDGLYRRVLATHEVGEREAAAADWIGAACSAAPEERATADDIVPLLASPDGEPGRPGHAHAGLDAATPGEWLNPCLRVVYAVDTPHGAVEVPPSWFAARGVDPAGLRRRAVANLRATLPGLHVQRGGGLNVVIAGGRHESALLLFDEFWARERPRLRGDALVAVPARDVLLFCDGAKAKAVDELRRQAASIHADAAFPLTPVVFLRHADGRVEPVDARAF